MVATIDIEVPAWRLRLKGCLWHRKGQSEWVSFPSKEWVDRNGKRQFADLIEFTDRAVLDRFKAAALQAIHAIADKEEPMLARAPP